MIARSSSSSQGIGALITDYFGNGSSAAMTLTLPSRPSLNLPQQRLVKTLARAMDAAADNDTKSAKIALARANMLVQTHPKSLPQGIDPATIRAKMALVPHGLPPLKALAGVRPVIEFGPGLNVIAAPTSAGKTTILLHQILEWLQDPKTGTGKILLWSCETPAPFAVARIIANQAGTSMWDVIDAERRGTAVSPDIYTAWQTLNPVLNRLIILAGVSGLRRSFEENLIVFRKMRRSHWLSKEPYKG